MANKIKVGIIGCGGICNGKHYPTLKKMKDIEIIQPMVTIRARMKQTDIPAMEALAENILA